MCHSGFHALVALNIFPSFVATLLAHGCPLQAIVAAFKLDERTVMDWQERTGQHCQQVHAPLVQWSYLNYYTSPSYLTVCCWTG